jgi:hypothetical protein
MGVFDFLGTILSGGAGGIVGAIGAIAQKGMELKLKDKEIEEKKIDNTQALALRDKDLTQARFEAESQLKIHQVDADSLAVVNDLKSLSESVAADRATYGDSKSGRFVDFIRGMARPVLTTWGAAITTYITYESYTRQPVVLSQEQVMNVLNSVMFLSALAISWWFGARPPSKRGA